MTLRTILLSTLAIGAMASVPNTAAQDPVPQVSADGTYPLEFWAAQRIASNARLNPDATKISMMVRPGLGQAPILQVYDADDLTAEPKRYGANSLEIVDAEWLDNDMMIVTFRGQVRERIRGFNDGTFRFTAATLNTKNGKFKELSEGEIVSTLPTQKNKVLLRTQMGRDDAGAVRAASYYVLDTKRGSKKLLLKGNFDTFFVGFDDEGKPRRAATAEVTGNGVVFKTLYRKPGEKSWSTIYEQSEDSFETFEIEGYTDDPDVIYVRAHNGEDKIGLWTYDVERKAFKDLIARDDTHDVFRVVEHSDDVNHPDEVVGVAFGGDKVNIDWFDEEEGRLRATLEASIPNAHQVRIVDRSRDGEDMIVFNNGPKDSGTYYLLKDGALRKLASENPFVSGETLADVEYVTYESRDGRDIPAYVTLPTKGEAPYPAIVLPHGGPFVQEVVGYDKWSQMLANRGYVVIQPQYRGSRGYGLEHYQAAFIDGGKGGREMQDDKDDGALYLVQRGLADPDRLAMFGWSYGGYAALAAASREPQIYQCAIAGASVPDNTEQVNYYRDEIRGSARTEQLKFWDESFSAIDNAEAVNIPLLLIHGTSDQRTPIRAVKSYMKKLDDAGIAYEYVELPKSDHFFGTIGYENELKAYTAMIDFLENDCGPDGL